MVRTSSGGGCLSVGFNLIWIVTGGWFTALWWLLAGLALCVTIIGIPLGRQAFKMAALTIAPFGRTIVYGGGAASFIGNVVWLLLVGFEMMVAYLAVGLVFCCTIAGIPFGAQLFKMAKLSLMPFGSAVL